MLQDLTRNVMKGGHLSTEEAESALDLILSDETPEAAIASFLTALAVKGETPEEIAGFARVMRREAIPIRSSHTRLIDTAGTGGGGDTFNISTAAAFVIAGAGVAVAKHGNRAMTSRCGSADVLAALGVRIDTPPETAERCLEEGGLAFLFAPLFHPAMKRVAAIRRQLGHRTVFNLLGPLTNPAAAPFQIIGVYSSELTRPLAEALSRLETGGAWVVHSRDGLDELSVLAPSTVSEVKGSHLRSFEFDPATVGLASADGREELKGGTPEENAAKILAVLEGRTKGPARDVVVLNAAAALHVAGEGDLAQAVEKAGETLDTGAALEKLRRLIDLTAS